MAPIAAQQGGGTSRGLPDGFLDVFDVSQLPSTLSSSSVFVEQGGKAVRNTPEKGFLCYGQYQEGYPQIPLKVFFSIWINDNSANDQNIAILDVYDHHSDRVIGKRVITRKDFQVPLDFSLFEFDFTPPSDRAKMEFRIYYMGDSSIIANRIVVIDSSKAGKEDVRIYLENTSGGGTTTDTNTNVTGTLAIDDPLTNNQSRATVHGGLFTTEGYKVTTTVGGYLAYSTDIRKNIRIEFDAKGYRAKEDDGTEGKIIIMEVFDTDHGHAWVGHEMYDSPYCLYHLRKRGLYQGQDHIKVDGLQLKFGGKGRNHEYSTWQGHGASGHPLSWDPYTTYHWVFTIQNGTTRMTRNGQVIFDQPVHEFDPDGALNIRIGGAGYAGRTGSRDVTYSNVKIYRL